MAIDPTAVGTVGKSTRRSWQSKDALLYALGVGAGVDELAFTTENTKDLPQRVLPTFGVILTDVLGESASRKIVTGRVEVNMELDLELQQLYDTATRDGERILDLDREAFAIVDDDARQ